MARQSAARPAPLALDDVDAVFRGFADPTRIRILNLLVAGELCVCDIVEILHLPQPAVSRHLAYLRRAGLVAATREWKYAHYRLAEPATLMDAALELAREVLEGAPLSVKAARDTVMLATEMGRAKAIDAGYAAHEACYNSADAQEGPRAFAEKRKPVWTGH